MRSRAFLVLSVAAGACASPQRTSAIPPPASYTREPRAATAPEAAVASPGMEGVPAPAPAKRPGAYANLDPDDDLVIGPPGVRAECDAELAQAGVTYRTATLAVHSEGRRTKITCGAPQVVTYLRGPGGITYNAPPLLTCGMALALATFEKLVQEEATQKLGARVKRIDHIGTYSCREMLNYPGWVSEHAYANAIDIGRFVLSDGRTVEVLRDFDTGDDPPKRPSGAFLRAVSRRANDEDVFSHVLTPFFDALHKNHFHLDLARYRTDGTRPRS